MAGSPTLWPRTAILGGVLVLVLVVAVVPGGAGATGQALTPIRSDPAWYGGAAPQITRVDTGREFRDSKSDRYYLRGEAVVRRLGSDRNGRIVLLRAKTWRDAFDELDRLASAKLGIRRGLLRDSVIKTFGYSRAELRKPFPDLTAPVAYDLFVTVENARARENGPAAKRPGSASTFVEPLSIGIPPGTHELGVIACFWPDESHPLAKPFAWLVREAIGAGRLAAARNAILAAIAAGSAGPLGPLLAKALAVQLGKSFLITAITCATSSSKATYRTKVPKLVGLEQDVALREVRARWLKAELDPDIVQRASCAGFDPVVVRQSPAPGTAAPRDAKVVVVTRHCVELAPSGWTADWTWRATRNDDGRVFESTSPMTIVQQGQTVCSQWSFSRGGTAKGSVSGATWSASWYDGFGKGTWTLTLQSGGREFRGIQTIDPHGPAGIYSATILGKRRSSTSRSLNCATLKVGP